MKTSLLPLAGIIPAALIAPLSAQSPGNFVNSTPGSASWSQEATATGGTRTIFTINANSVFQWTSGFNLAEGNEIVFDFTGGDSLVNLLGGSGVNSINGTVTSNGNVSFISPQADLVVGGSITAKSVTLSTLDADPAALMSGNNVSFTGSPSAFNGLQITGTIKSTGGDIVLTGQRVTLSEKAQIRAKGDALIAGGSRIDLDRGVAAGKIKSKAGDGIVLHVGNTRASRIEVSAGSQITQKGGMKAPRIFLEVGPSGQIVMEKGIVLGSVEAKGSLDSDGVEGNGHTDQDAVSSLHPSILKAPGVKRPDGSTVSTARTVVSNVPVSASADSGRDRKAATSAVASRDKDKTAKPMMQRASFFGMRGGSETVKAEKDNKR